MLTDGWKYLKNSPGELIWFDKVLRNRILANSVRVTFNPHTAHPFVEVANIGTTGLYEILIKNATKMITPNEINTISAILLIHFIFV